MRKVLVSIALPVALGLILAQTERVVSGTVKGPMCETVFSGPTGFTSDWSYSDGLWTTVSQLVECYPTTINPCTIGVQQVIHQPGTSVTLDNTCLNYNVPCGEEATVGQTEHWGAVPSGTYDCMSYWQYYGCNPDDPVDMTNTEQIEVP